MNATYLMGETITDFEALSVFDEGSIDLSRWILSDAQRQLLESYQASGWRLVTLAARAEGERVAVFYQRLLRDYDDSCESLAFTLARDGSTTELAR